MPLIRSTGEPFRRPAAAFLYHGSAMTIERARLTPRFNHTVGGHAGKFVFATDNPDLARCYALKDEHMIVIGMMPDETTPYCIIRDREAYLAAHITGTVYKFPGDGFREVRIGSYATGEFVTGQTVRLHRAERIPVSGLDDLIDRGIAVFATRNGLTERDFLLALRRAQYSPVTLEQTGIIIRETARHIQPAP